jgi:hypothetical protein
LSPHFWLNYRKYRIKLIFDKTLKKTYFGCSFASHVTLVPKIPLSVPIEDIKSSLNTYSIKHSLPDVHIKTLDTGSEFFKRIFLQCQKSDSLVSIARFTKQTFIGNDEDIDQWIYFYNICREKRL